MIAQSTFTQQEITLPFGRDGGLRVRKLWLFLLLTLLAAAFLRFYGLDRWSFWTDELYTMLKAPTLRIISEGIPDDQHPPLYLILVHYLLLVGDGEIWLRLPSAIAGFLAIPFMYRTAVLLGNERWGLLTAVLFTFSPLLIWYAREARMYGPAQLAWGMSLYFYVRILRRDRWFDAVGLAVSTLLGIFLTYSTLGLWAIEVGLFLLIWHLFGHKMGRLFRFIAAQMGIAAVFIWWQPYFNQQMGRNLVFDWAIIPGLDFSTTLDGLGQVMMIGAAGLLLGGTLLWLLVWWQPRLLALAQKMAPLTAVLIVILFTVVLIIGTIPRGLSIRRQLLVFMPLLILAGAWALLTLHQRWLTVGLIGLAAVLSLFPVFGPPVEDWRGVSAFISAEAESGDKIIIAPGWQTMALDYYQPSIPYSGVNRTEMPDEESGTRIWFILADHPLTKSQTQTAENWYTEHGRLLSSTDFSRYITVIEYQIE